MSAPILNFRLINTIVNIHGILGTPCDDISHDLLNHCNLTHKIDEYIENSEASRDIKNSKTSQDIKDIYNNRNLTIKQIKPLIDYDKKAINHEYLTNKNSINFINMCILFIILHEKGEFNDNLTIDELIKAITDYKTYSETSSGQFFISKNYNELKHETNNTLFGALNILKYKTYDEISDKATYNEDITKTYKPYYLMIDNFIQNLTQLKQPATD